MYARPTHAKAADTVTSAMFIFTRLRRVVFFVIRLSFGFENFSFYVLFLFADRIVDGAAAHAEAT